MHRFVDTVLLCHGLSELEAPLKALLTCLCVGLACVATMSAYRGYSTAVREHAEAISATEGCAAALLRQERCHQADAKQLDATRHAAQRRVDERHRDVAKTKAEIDAYRTQINGYQDAADRHEAALHALEEEAEELLCVHDDVAAGAQADAEQFEHTANTLREAVYRREADLVDERWLHEQELANATARADTAIQRASIAVDERRALAVAAMEREAAETALLADDSESSEWSHPDEDLLALQEEAHQVWAVEVERWQQRVRANGRALDQLQQESMAIDARDNQVEECLALQDSGSDSAVSSPGIITTSSP